jgi:hypothetical protein
MPEYKEWLYPLLTHICHTIEHTHTFGLDEIRPGGFFILPGVARYNMGFNLVSVAHRLGVSDPFVPLTFGSEWQEVGRLRHTTSNSSARYWAHTIRIVEPKSGTYRITWQERTIAACVPGLREARLDESGTVLWDGRVTMLRTIKNPDDRYPNGVAWDALPEGYRVEVWRKTRKKQSGVEGMYPARRKSGVRWMLWRALPPSAQGINLEATRRGKDTGTEAFRFAFITPDGARSFLSPEVAVFHGGKKPWGPRVGATRQIPYGRVRLK